VTDPGVKTPLAQALYLLAALYEGNFIFHINQAVFGGAQESDDSLRSEEQA
jgi:hypothetical protein